MTHEVMIPENSEVILADGQVHSVELLAEMTRKPVFYQAERVRQRVELIPEGFGAWDMVTQNDIFLGDQTNGIQCLFREYLGGVFTDRNERQHSMLTTHSFPAPANGKASLRFYV